MKSLVAPDDWVATCCIYEDDDNCTIGASRYFMIRDGKEIEVDAQHDVNINECSMETSIRLGINTRGLLFVFNSWKSSPLSSSRDTDDTLWTKQDIEYAIQPQLEEFWLRFRYRTVGDIAEVPYSVDVEPIPAVSSSKPSRFPESWLKWLRDSLSEMLKVEPVSYLVCDFLVNQATSFFPITKTSPITSLTTAGVPAVTSGDEFSVVMAIDSEEFQKASDFISSPIHKVSFQEIEKLYVQILSPPKSKAIVKGRGADVLAQPTDDDAEESRKSRLQCAVNGLLLDNWSCIKCPICFDWISLKHSFKLTCGHMYCHDCIKFYTSFLVRQLDKTCTCPFLCSIRSCREEMNLKNCVSRLISASELEIIKNWQIRIATPFITPPAVAVCFRKKCNGDMKRLENASPISFVICVAQLGVRIVSSVIVLSTMNAIINVSRNYALHICVVQKNPGHNSRHDIRGFGNMFPTEEI